MKIFASWSGPRSHAVASALREWIPDILQAATVWLSSEDIAKGSRPLSDIEIALQDALAGVICLTADNKDYAPWLLFEAGALSKSLGSKAYVCTYLLDIGYADVPQGPLTQFQHTLATREDTLKLIKSLNSVSNSPLDESRVTRLFDQLWPTLERKLKEIPPAAVGTSTKRSDRELLEEVLSLTRGSVNQRPAAYSIVDSAPAPGIFATRVHVIGREGNRRDSHILCRYCGAFFQMHFYEGDGTPKLPEMLRFSHYRECPALPDHGIVPVFVQDGSLSRLLMIDVRNAVVVASGADVIF